MASPSPQGKIIITPLPVLLPKPAPFPTPAEPPKSSSSSATAPTWKKKLRSSSTRLIEPILTPRFVPTCSNELLRGLGNLSQAKCLRIQSHMAESHDQVQWVRKERGKEDMDVFESVSTTTTITSSSRTPPAEEHQYIYIQKLNSSLDRPSDLPHNTSTLHFPRPTLSCTCLHSWDIHRPLPPFKFLLLCETFPSKGSHQCQSQSRTWDRYRWRIQRGYHVCYETGRYCLQNARRHAGRS